MIIKDKARDYHLSDNPMPSLNAILSFSEKCCVCSKDIPNLKLVLRKVETQRIICSSCLIEIASAKDE